MKHVIGKFILQLPLPEQKGRHAAVANDLLQTASSEPDFLKKVKTGDELRVYGCDVEMKAQLCEWKLPGSLRMSEEGTAKSQQDPRPR